MYPLSLLPNISYKISIDVDCLIQHDDYSLIRRVDLPMDKIYDDTIDVFYPSIFTASQIPGMSTNLLCKNCDENSTNFTTSSKGSEPWDGTEVKIEDFNGMHHKTPEHTNIYIPIRKIHNVEIPLKYNSDAGTKKDLERRKITGLVEMTEGDKEILKGTGVITILHKPTFLNYWHFEFTGEAENVVIAKSHNKTIKKALYYFIEHHLTAAASLELPEVNKSDPSVCYSAAS